MIAKGGNLKPRERRTLLGGVALILMVLAAGPGAGAITRSYARLAEDKRALAADHRMLRHASQRSESHAALRTELAALESMLFPNADPVLLEAAAHEYVMQLANVSRLPVRVRRAERHLLGESGYPHVMIEIGGEGRLLNVLQFLHRLENGPRLARIDALVIESQSSDGPVEGVRLSSSIAFFGRAP